MRRVLPVLLMVLVAPVVLAQDAPPTFAAAVSALKDPTTYAPAVVFTVSAMGDWHSSQPWFADGATEGNPRYTLTGTPHSAPMSEAAGNRLILGDAIRYVGLSAANNLVAHVVTSKLTAAHPEHRKLYAALGVVERVGVMAAVSYASSVLHFEQWHMNLAR